MTSLRNTLDSLVAAFIMSGMRGRICRRFSDELLFTGLCIDTYEDIVPYDGCCNANQMPYEVSSRGCLICVFCRPVYTSALDALDIRYYLGASQSKGIY